MEYILKLDEFVRNKCGGLKGREKNVLELVEEKKKKGVVDCVFNVSKKEKKKNMDMTHEKNWKGKGVRRKNKIQKKRMCMLWKK